MDGSLVGRRVLLLVLPVLPRRAQGIHLRRGPGALERKNNYSNFDYCLKNLKFAIDSLRRVCREVCEAIGIEEGPASLGRMSSGAPDVVVGA